MFFTTIFKRAINIATGGNSKGLYGYVSAVFLAGWLMWGIWSDGPPVGGDTIAHLIRAEYAINQFVLNGRLDGWQPSFALGYQQHLFIGPVLSWCVAMVQGLSLGMLSTVTSFKVAIFLLFAALPLAAGYLARSFGLSRPTSGIAAILSLAVSSPFGGFGLNGLFDVGLTVNLAGAVILCLALGAMMRLMVKPSAYRALLGGVLFALLAATHGISLILAVAILPVLLMLTVMESQMQLWLSTSRLSAFQSRLIRYCGTSACEPNRLRVTPIPQLARWVGLSALVAIALSAWIVIPLLVHYNLRGILTGWAHTPFLQRLSDIWNGHILFRNGVSVWVAIGLVYGLWRVICGRPLALVLVLAPLAFLCLGEVFTVFAPENVVSQQIPNRGLGLAGLLSVFPLAALMTTTARVMGKFQNFCSVIIGSIFIILAMGDIRPMVRPVTPTPVALEAAAELRNLVPDGARYAMQRDFPAEIGTVGMSHPDFWMAWQSKRNTLNVFNVESSTTPTPAYAPDSMTTLPPDQVADDLSRYGVTHILLVNMEKAAMLLTAPRFKLVWQNAPLAIVSVIPRDGQPSPSSLLATQCPAQARLISSDPEKLSISVTMTKPCSATIAVAWSPKWVASLDGTPIKLNRTQEGLLTLSLPAGTHIISIAFQQDIYDKLSILVSALAVLLILVIRWKWHRFLALSELLKNDETHTNYNTAVSPANHWSTAQKKEVVLRLFGGESVQTLSREFSVPIFRLEQWHDLALSGIVDSLSGSDDNQTSRDTQGHPEKP